MTALDVLTPNNARYYGAKGDGVTDDSAAIQAALDYVGANGGIMFLPEGRYLLNTRIRAQNYPSAWSLIGAGTGNTFLLRGSHTLNVFEVNSCNNVTLSDFSIEGRGTPSHPLAVFNTSDFLALRLSARDCNSGVFLAYGNNAERVVFRSCIAANAPLGFILSDLIASSIEDSYAYNIDNAGTTFAFELKNTCTGCTITNCYAEDCGVAFGFGWTENGPVQNAVAENIRCVRCKAAFLASNTIHALISDVAVSLTGANAAAIKLTAGSNGVGVNNTIFNNVVLDGFDGGAGTSAVAVRIEGSSSYNQVNVDYLGFASSTLNSYSLASFGSSSLLNTVSYGALSLTSVTNPYPYSLNAAVGQNAVLLGNTASLQPSTALVSDTLTLYNPKIRVVYADTEGGAGTDNLATISAGVDGQVITLIGTNGGRLITVQNQVGNLRLDNTRDLLLTPQTTLTLMYSTLTSRWYEISRAYGPGPALTTTSNGGFQMIVGVNGVPTGTPTSPSRSFSMVYDALNNRPYWYSSSAWRGAVMGCTNGCSVSTAGLLTITNGGTGVMTAATSGFFYESTSVGTPTGVPTGTPAGFVPCLYDTTNDKRCCYNGGWKCSPAFT